MSARISPKHAGLLAQKLAESERFHDLADRASQLKRNEVETLSEYLWNSTKSQQHDALQSKFIQGVQYGNLDPTDFGGYMVQEAAFCYNSMESIIIVASKENDPIWKAFLETIAELFRKYHEELFKRWHIRDPKGIDLSKACKDYVDLEKSVAETMDPLYLLLAFIPGCKLWTWLGKQISDQPHNFGAYENWVMSNLDPNSDGYKILEQIIDYAFQLGEIDKEKALSIYQGCMTGEAKFFSIFDK